MDHEPAGVGLEGAQRRSRFLITCDHAGNRFPERLGDLGVSASERQRHIAWDIGAHIGAASVALLADDRIERFPASMYSYLLMSGPVVVFDPAAPAATDYLLVLTRRLAPPAVAALTPVVEKIGRAHV